MDNNESRENPQQMQPQQRNTLSGLPPLPKSLLSASAIPTEQASGHTQGLLHDLGQTQMRAHASSHLQISKLTTAAADLYLGPSTSVATRNRNNNGHGRPGSLSSTQESLSDRESLHSRASSTHSGSICAAGAVNSTSNNASTTIDNQLAILRREMYGLRQLDLSLLSQLWALNESIQGFRVFLQDQDNISPTSRSRTPSDANSFSSDEDGSYAPLVVPKLNAPPASMSVLSSPAATKSGLSTKLATGSTTSNASTSSTSGASGSSSAASSMGKHHHSHQQIPPYHQIRSAHPPAPPTQHKSHPQLPRILQQRMRHAPPPPPPTRIRGGASSSSSNHSISSVTQQQQYHQHTHQQRPV